jgi:hypothetical protein
MFAVAFLKKINLYLICQFAENRRWVPEFVVVLAVKDEVPYSQLKTLRNFLLLHQILEVTVVPSESIERYIMS